MSSTLYVTLQGGLANTAIQYAAATKMARATGRKVVCDLSFLNAHQDPNAGITPRQFTLNTLLTEPAETVDQTPPGVIPLSGEVESVPDDGKDYRIQGYFQRLSALPDYKDLNEMLRTSFVMDHEEELIAFYRRVATAKHRIGIHVRRADYLTPNALAFHGVLGLDYYKRATEYIYLNKMLKREDVQLVVYSDDVPWCKDHLVPHLGFTDVLYAKDYITSDAYELYSMRYIDHFVIANSSFSWLGRLTAMTYNRNSTVYPLRWFRSYSPTGMMPKEWIGV